MFVQSFSELTLKCEDVYDLSLMINLKLKMRTDVTVKLETSGSQLYRFSLIYTCRGKFAFNQLNRFFCVNKDNMC